MEDNLNTITKLERGRAEFAYDCVNGLKKLKVESSKYPCLHEGIENFKHEMIKSFEKQIDKKKIEDILDKLEHYAANKLKLSEEERKIIVRYESLLSNFRSYVRKIPQMILSNGLGQTLAFVFAKKEKGNAYDMIYRMLTDYLKSNAIAGIGMSKDKDDLVKWIISLNSYDYRYVTEEIFAFLNWLKKFAEGMIQTTEEEA